MSFARLSILAALAGPFAMATAAPRDVRFLAWDDAVADRPVAVIQGGEPRRVDGLHPLQRSQPVRAQSIDGRLSLVVLDGENNPPGPAFNVALPDTLSRPLVVLMPDERAPSGLRGFAIEDSVRDFPWGAFRMINATDRNILVRLGATSHRLPVGMVPVNLTAPSEGNHPVLFAAEDAPEQPVYSSIWSADAGVRRLIIVLPGTDARLGLLALKVIPEFRSAEPAATR